MAPCNGSLFGAVRLLLVQGAWGLPCWGGAPDRSVPARRACQATDSSASGGGAAELV